MPTLTTIISALTAVSSIAVAAPLSVPLQSRQSSDPACVNGVKRIFEPELYNVYYFPGAVFPSKSTVINVFNDGRSGGYAEDQVARWTDIPAGAQNCTIGWSQAAERSFSVYGNGLVSFAQLSGIPDVVTADTIGAYNQDGAPEGAMDFTNWPQVTGNTPHIGGVVDCRSDIVVRMYKELGAGGGAGSVTLEQNASNGFWLEHSC